MSGESLLQSFDDYVSLSVKSGVAPIELLYRPIIDCETGRVLALLAETVINSSLLGRLNEVDYTGVCDGRLSGIALFVQSLRHALCDLDVFRARFAPPSFLSIRCPAELAEAPDVDLFSTVRNVLKGHRNVSPSALCIAFPASLTEKQTEKARKAILDLKVLKVKTLITGCGKEDFPISKLVTITPDAVVLDESATAWAGSRDKPRLFPALVTYLKSMGIEAYAEGAEEKRHAMRNTDCAGFIDRERQPLSREEILSLLATETAI